MSLVYCLNFWSDGIFQTTLLDQDIRGTLLMQARTEAKERLTLLHLKRKYPGTFSYVIVILQLCLYLILIFFSTL